MLILFTILGPAFLLVVLLTFLGIYFPNELWFSYLILSAILSLGIGIWLFRDAFNRLTAAATSVSYIAFQPSLIDLGVHLIRQVYVILFMGFGLFYILRFVIQTNPPFWVYFVISIIFSFGIQLIQIIIGMNAKKGLLASAREPIESEIIEWVTLHHPNSDKIDLYRYADLQPATLFLSAGVTTLGFKRICLVSRYFQWKLSQEELISVLSHEEGHAANQHILKSYLVEALVVILRTLRLFSIIYGLDMVLKAINQNTTILNDESFGGYLILTLFTFIASTFLAFYRGYQMHLNEIEADMYGANIVGEILANTLRKLPSTIPSPVGYSQTSFLGFRVALLRNLVNEKDKNDDTKILVT